MPDYSTWLTKQQAANALQCATKTVEQLAKAKKLQTTMYKRPTGGPAIAVYHPDDVERLRKERNPEAEPFIVPAGAEPTKALQRAGNGKPTPPLFDQFAEWLTGIRNEQQPPAIPLREKVFLTMPEAVQFTGLPDAVIRRMIHAWEAQKPGAPMIMAILTGQGWRVRRKDLEAL